MRFSVVIPARNAQATVGRAVRSASGSLAAEVVVVDDGSTDATAQEATAAGARVVRGEGRGVAAARNAGLRAAREPWVALLDADDEWLPGHLDGLARAIDAVPDAAVCFGAALHESADGRRLATATVSQRHATLPGLLERRLQPTTSATALRRDAALAIGGFDEGFRRGAGVEDIDLWWRLAAGHPCAVAPVPRARYVVHEQRDRVRTRDDLHDLAADRRRYVARVGERIGGRLFARAAAQSHAVMARYWYLAGYTSEGRSEAVRSLRYAATWNGVGALGFGLLPAWPRERLRILRQALVSRRRAR
jgi:glycosyltransferase involved in cell wall biosynthesis